MKNEKFKVIFHLDLDAFFCSVEEIKYPFLKNKPFAIGNAKQSRGVISTSNYEARKYKVKSAMSTQEAIKLCPNLILVSSNFSDYNRYSKLFFDILFTFTKNILIVSIDEAYMDVTDLVEDKKSYFELAQKIQNLVKEKLNLTVSIGIAPNLFLAKMASELKKPNGIMILRKRDIITVLGDHNIKELNGLGKKSCERLYEKNIFLIKELLYEKNKDVIINCLSIKLYEDLMEKLTGQSSNIIDVDKYSSFQSMSTSHTFSSDLEDFELIMEEFKHQIKMLIKRLKKENRMTKTISITLKQDNFSSIIRSKTIENYTDNHITIEYIVYELFEENWNEQKIRLIGVGFSNFSDEKTNEVPVIEEKEEDFNLFNYEKYINRKEYIELVVTNINRTYDKEIVFQVKNKKIDSKNKHKSLFD